MKYFGTMTDDNDLVNKKYVDEAVSESENIIANEYSSSSTYAVGSYVIYEGNLYRCTTAITTAEAWNSSHWTQVTVGGEFVNNKNAHNTLQNLISANTQLIAGELENTANFYNPTNTYNVGDYVLQSVTTQSGTKYNLFRCTTQISTPEAWNSAHWVQTTIGEDLSNTVTQEDLEQFAFGEIFQLHSNSVNKGLNWDWDNTTLHLHGTQIKDPNVTYDSSFYSIFYGQIANSCIIPGSNLALTNSKISGDANNPPYLNMNFYGEGGSLLDDRSFNLNTTRTNTQILVPDGTVSVDIFIVREYVAGSENVDWTGKIQLFGYVNGQMIGETFNKVAEDLSDLETEVGDVKNDLGYTVIVPTRGGYIATSSNTTDYTVVSNNSYWYSVIDCTDGAMFTVAGVGSSAARLWAFVDRNGNILSKALENATETGLFLKAPAGAIKLVINTQTNVNSYIGWLPVNAVIASIDGRMENVETLLPVNYSKNSFVNDMSTQKGKIPGLQCYKNGVANEDNYGQDSVRYVMDLAPYNKLHVVFDFKYSESVPYVSNSERFGLFTAQSGKVTVYEQFRKAASANGYVQRNVYYGYRIGTGTPQNVTNFVGAKFNGHNGKPAFWVQYTGNSSSAYMRPQSGGVLLYDGTSTTVSYLSTDSVDSLIAAINNVSGFSAGYVETSGKTCGELMLYEGDTIQLCYNVTLYGESSATVDKPKVYVPYAHNTDWHTFECCIDESALRMYYAIDGMTGTITLAETDLRSGVRNIMIGGTFNGAESFLTIRNLQVDMDSYGDAEIITQYVWNYATAKQLISNRNPKLLIFEGHGIDVCAEKDAPLSDEMAASTDRLRILFDALTNAGYTNISYGELKDWKIHNKPIPKRSFLIMMDDYRVENFVDIEKRAPFVQFGFVSGLAIISDRYSADEVFEINGTNYSRSECFNAINTNSWYPCSHTRDHRRFTSVLPSATEYQLSLDVISADKLNIHSDVMVYPYGEFSASYIPAMIASDFVLGINIVKNQYNCRAINNYYLSRVELGQRCSMNDLLAQIV